MDEEVDPRGTGIETLIDCTLQELFERYWSANTSECLLAREDLFRRKLKRNHLRSLPRVLEEQFVNEPHSR